MTLSGTVLDSAGVPLLGARVRIQATDHVLPDIQDAMDSVLTDEDGRYRVTWDAVPPGADWLHISVRSPQCSPTAAGIDVAIPLAFVSPPAAQVDLIVPTAAPSPSPRNFQLCTYDGFRELDPWGPYAMRLVLHLDSLQTQPYPEWTAFASTWNEHTNISTVGWAGTFVGVETPEGVLLYFTYLTSVLGRAIPPHLPAVALPSGFARPYSGAAGRGSSYRSTAPPAPWASFPSCSPAIQSTEARANHRMTLAPSAICCRTGQCDQPSRPRVAATGLGAQLMRGR